METKVSEIKIDMPARKRTCKLCFSDDINADQMFSVDECSHEFCSECVKRHIEVRLHEGSLMRCPGFRCKSMLTYGRCVKLLTPKLKEMWKQRIKEDSIPVMDRVYCPNPRCSAIMLETRLSKLTEVNKSCCVKCGEHFCIKCKVPWHNDLSCDLYKKLHPNPTTNDEMLKHLANKKLWRQCRKCQHMIELSRGCVRVRCRCGLDFCYRCGADAGDCLHGHGYYYPAPAPAPPIWCLWFFFFVFFVVIIAIIAFRDQIDKL